MDYPTKICEQCSSTFSFNKTMAYGRWLEKQKYCSAKCGYDARRKYKEPKICGHCGQLYSKDNASEAKWDKRKYCSPECFTRAKQTPWLKEYQFKPGFSPTRGRFKEGETTTTNNVNWKGDNASYAAKHTWVARNFGKPQMCEKCKTTEKRMYHWANISKEYKRERDDWLRLCVPCHKRLDLSNPKG